MEELEFQKDILAAQIEKAKLKGFSYFVRISTTPNGEKEIIVTQDARQLDYILEAYDDDLCLKRMPKIKIVSWCFG